MKLMSIFKKKEILNYLYNMQQIIIADLEARRELSAVEKNY